ncbi:hypothetical protein WBJ53_12210 [Spirosoma sp. SC4-14]|uniref:hypothetical protein n=1 Tax=Spirosoma sp. SC4-14 TaxID=3128900 RepID=UPI0030D5C089
MIHIPQVAMRFFVLFFSFHLYFFIQPCQAQDCSLIQKIEASNGVGYMAVIDTLTEVDSTHNQLYMLMLGKTVSKIDTTYLLNIGLNATGVSENGRSEGIVLQFGDGSTISRPNQALDVISMPNNQAILSVLMDLSSAEIAQMKNKLLANVTLASSTVVLAEGVAKSVRIVASCLPVMW